MHATLTIRTPGRGLHEITEEVARQVAVLLGGARGARGGAGAGTSGLCTLFIRHTSASLLIQENADATARKDLEAWFERAAPEHDPLYTHKVEGPDDMPAHVRAALTAVSLSIPIVDGRLALGRWQGIFVFEHRRAPHAREVVVQVTS